MPNSFCRICLQPLKLDHQLYHPACCKTLFGSAQVPHFSYSWDQLNALAEQVIRQHVTVPGVQPKLSLHLERTGGTRTSRLTLVGLEGGYILKPPVERYPQMPELEHLTMQLAGCFGIATACCGLIALEEGRWAFITKRMDRGEKDKLHMEDMCQLTDRLTDQKYRGSMEQVGKAVLKHGSNPLFDALRLFELSLFCFLTGNADMHLKNFSLLYALGGEITLSPAYDLLPTVLLLPEDLEETALTINGRRRRLTRDDFMQFGATLKLTERQLDNVFSRFLKQFPDALKLLEHGFCTTEMKAKYQELLKERAGRLGIL